MKSLHPCNSDLQRLRDRRHRLERKKKEGKVGKKKENLIWSWEVGGWKENKAYN